MTNIEKRTRKQETPAKEQNTNDFVCTKRWPDKGEDVILETHNLNTAQWAGMIPDHFTHGQPIVRCKPDPKT